MIKWNNPGHTVRDYSFPKPSLYMRNLWAFVAVAMLVGCRDSPPVFRSVSSDKSGIHFSNVLTESDSLNIISFEYFYNGAGIAAADFNNDGLTDLFFAGNLTTSRLY